MNTDDALTKRARAIFSNNPTTFNELVELGAKLRRANRLDDARRMFEKALFTYGSEANEESQTTALRDLILCTYKDPDLPADTRLQNAEQMLNTVLGEPLGRRADPPQKLILALAGSLHRYPGLEQDLLGIAGAVQKRRWDIYGLRAHLVRSYQYYKRGYEMGSDKDRGYNGINLAFVLDLLSEQEKGELGEGSAARELALQVRMELVAILDPRHTIQAGKEYYKLSDPDLLQDWWVLVTLGEAWLGIGDYQKARYWMVETVKLKTLLEQNPDVEKHIAPWQLETAVRQIAQVARIRAIRDKIPANELEASPAWSVVKALLEGDSQAAESFLHGKIGLALSGGGFRASLFHIGLLAKLAELDVLRHVEVLSCVSGGSILGAYYYLELRNMLQTHTDAEINRQCYIDLIERIRVNFLKGIQRNIRLRMLLGWRSNAKVLSSRRSSSSDRLADLYEDELYALVSDGENGKPRYLADLFVAPLIETRTPQGEVHRQAATSFNPRYDNWKRNNKVPALILNATSLNSCHNWQFTASFMGEPPARSIDTEIDANHRMRRMYHREAPGRYRRDSRDSGEKSGVRLGEAVAASACVPGLFDPLVLQDLYGKMGAESEDYMMRLVDGGNYDNQGIASLREQDCTVLLISDACGQTGMSLDPSSGHIGVVMRANDILMARVRETQYQLLSNLTDVGAVQGVLYVHLKKDLKAQVIDWKDCDDPSTYERPAKETSYGVREDVQRLLASIRTDLDSFSWLESDALMLSAYLMTGTEWDKCLPNFSTSSEAAATWDFQQIGPLMTAQDPKGGHKSLDQLKKSLKIASKLEFKPFQLYPSLKRTGIVLAIVALAAFAWIISALWAKTIEYLGSLSSTQHIESISLWAIFGVLFLIVMKEVFLKKMLKYRNGYIEILGAIMICTFGWILVCLYLRWIDPLYVNWGSEYRIKAAQQG
jgi:predicted acylesterase/phospholipase RssA